MKSITKHQHRTICLFLPLCSWLWTACDPAASRSLCPAFPSTVDGILKSRSKIKHPSLSCFCQIFCQSDKTGNKYVELVKGNGRANRQVIKSRRALTYHQEGHEWGWVILLFIEICLFYCMGLCVFACVCAGGVCACVCVCLCVHVHHMCAVPKEAKRGQQIPWD